MTRAAHLVRPSEAAQATAVKRATARDEKRTADFNKALLPGLVAERKREQEARLIRAKLPSSQVPMCNATMPGRYRTGDGEVLQQPRPGSMHAFTLPSYGDKT